MGLNNQIANLQARYEHANIKALESEDLVTQIKNNAVKQLGEIDTVFPIKIFVFLIFEFICYLGETLDLERVRAHGHFQKTPD